MNADHHAYNKSKVKFGELMVALKDVKSARSKHSVHVTFSSYKVKQAGFLVITIQPSTTRLSHCSDPDPVRGTSTAKTQHGHSDLYIYISC